MPEFSVLLPPAEGKLPGGNPLAPDLFDLRSGGTFNYFSELNPERRRLITALQATMDDPETAAAVLGLKGDALGQARAANAALFGGPRMAALERYGPGVLYGAMEFAALPTGAQRRLLENVVIVSGVFGLLRPDDLIPDYKLPIDAVVPGIGKVSAYWRPVLSPLLNRVLAGRVVWDLLPAAHREAWDDAHTYAEAARVVFVRETDGERRPVTHGVKPLRGSLVAHLVREAGERVETIRSWRAPEGYRLDDDATTHDEATRTTTFTFVKR